MRVIPDILIAAAMVFSLQYYIVDATSRLENERMDERGFWVTYSEPGIKHTTVRYYANPTLLVAETKETCQLDIAKRSVRKYLDKKLKKEMQKDSTLDFWRNDADKKR